MKNYNYALEAELGLAPKLEDKYKSIPDEMTLTSDQVAELIGMSPVSVRRWCHNGKLPAYQFGRKYVITGEALKSFMQKSKIRVETAKDVFMN
ncbi:helix-turn-helix domain-containing protein [Paenibacillus sp. NEAU-GSW1]|uniref:helix-turn-helix domain-containing protein n=1 Tax=Paenibacillus sp. NEAU-GSW1 TaxID=2682486 RepID=UPI0012E1D6F1|nr:helix-turn-helix domain-containing protein [Paenibacillus sp. NEAU-GSW1]MUT68500.1 helix-turn-helix domain-containing protein [Paenibacillus sp. NEAU-GSW1]